MDVRPVTGLGPFLSFPRLVYRDDPHWVPPLRSAAKALLNPRKNPFFAHAETALFMAWDQGRPAGRVAAIIDRLHNEVHGERTGFFGFLEMARPDAAGPLLDRAAAWLAERGQERMRGPASPSLNDECGLLVDGFDGMPYLMMPYNPPWYARAIEDAGFAKVKDLIAYDFDILLDRPRLAGLAARLAERGGLTVRPVDLARFPEEIETIRRIYNAAWERNWGFVPLTDAEFRHKAAEMKPLVIPELVLIGEVHGEPAGFSLTLPNVNPALKRANGRLFPFGLLKLLWHSRHLKTLRMLAMGVVPEHRRAGLDLLFYVRSIEEARKRGFTRGELSWVLEDNEDLKRVLPHVVASPHRRYRLYERRIAS